MKNLYNRDYPVTSVLLLLTAAVFLLMFLRYGFAFSSGEAIWEMGAVYGPKILQPPYEFWRLFSAIFIHIGLEHFAMNMITLYFIGRQAEEIFGSAKFLLLYLASGFMGNVLALFFNPLALSAGASTALFGIFGAIAVLGYGARNPYLLRLGQTYRSLIIINIIFSFLPNVSLAGHVGGLIGGALCGVLLPVAGEKGAFSGPQRLLALAAYLVLVFILLGAALQRPLIPGLS